jgi:ketosteroid isomerase-like protein
MPEESTTPDLEELSRRAIDALNRGDIEDIIDAGDRVALFTHNSGVARSGVRLGVRVGHILTAKAGKIVRWQYFGEDRSACLKAVGLEE